MGSEPTLPTTRRNLPPAEIDCKWWKQGYCFRGSTCYFRHDPLVTGPDKPKHEASQVNNNVQPEAIQEPCAICLERPKVFGLLTNCNHVFCLTCIRGWRASARRTSPGDEIDSNDDPNCRRKVSKTCPICRTYSNFVVPSAVFPPSIETPLESRVGTENPAEREESGMKQKIINDYLDRLKRIPCRYFEESVKQQHESAFKPICRFGNECHYAHMDPITGQPYIFSPAELSAMKGKKTRNRRRSRQRPPDHELAAEILFNLAALDIGGFLSDDEEEDNWDEWSSD